MYRRRHTKAAHLAIGTISEGSLRPEDVIPELLYAAGTVRMTRADRLRVQAIARLAETDDCEDTYYSNPEQDPSGDWNTLLDILQSYAPPFCYVGPIQGDGACIGVWPDRDAIAMGVRDGEILKIDDGDARPTIRRRPKNTDPSPDAIVEVNDHGNTAVFVRRGLHWRLAWDCV